MAPWTIDVPLSSEQFFPPMNSQHHGDMKTKRKRPRWPDEHRHPTTLNDRPFHISPHPRLRPSWHFSTRILLGLLILVIRQYHLSFRLWEQSLENTDNDHEIAGCSSVLPTPEKSRHHHLIPKSHDVRSGQDRPCALLFFGLAKQFRSIVSPSIQKYILEVSENGRRDIFVHNYNVTESNNPRAGEQNTTIDPTEIYDLTKSENIVMETVDELLRQRDMEYYAHSDFQPDERLGWDHTALENMYKQWHSIERVWDRMEEEEVHRGIEYDRVGLFRSDVRYRTPIDIFDGDAVIPRFGFVCQ